VDAEFSQQYRRLYEQHWWFRVREELILKFLRRKQPPGGWGNILDVGCGDGLFFRELMKLGDVDGIELAGEIVSADNPYRQRIHIGAFDHTFQPEKRYSLILMLDVLEHLPDPVAALRKALSLLRPGGSLLITVPAFRALWTSHDTLNDHFTRYTKSSFRQVAAQAGMALSESRYLFYWLFWAKLAVRAKEFVLGSKPATPGVPPSLLNRLLLWVSRMEEVILGRTPVPWGSSLLVFGSAAPARDAESAPI
jgi:2-polyprenyl-3-methyl-5-hydroxy-6-metoxy-1,4-benzoquinol methylase